MQKQAPAQNTTESTPIKPTPQRRRPRRLLWGVLACFFLGLLVFSLFMVISQWRVYREGEAVYDALPRPAVQNAAPDDADDAVAALRAINPDYVGWLALPGTRLDYPVVQGRDNAHYLTTAFDGSYSEVGTPFMDWQAEPDFASAHTLVYAHNMKDGSMFGALAGYMEAGFLQDHPALLLTAGEETVEATVFYAAVTDAWDDCYALPPGDTTAMQALLEGRGLPPGTTRVLTLSTCTNVQDEERIIVHAALP